MARTIYWSTSALLGVTALAGFALFLSEEGEAKKGDGHGPKNRVQYEVWASDQSNSVAGKTALGIDGSFIWVWKSRDVEAQLTGGTPAQPVPCAGTAAPCDTNLVFPANLFEYDESNNPTGNNRPMAGRLHSAFIDPQQKYALLSFFAPGGGLVGIMDAETKEAVALFRATETDTGRTNHMSFWRFDGLAILLCNLDGRIVERIDVVRDATGRITALVYNRNAGLGVGSDQTMVQPPRVYLGPNAVGHQLIGSIQAGTPDFNNLTPNGFCKENGCAGGPNGASGGRPNNAILCPIPAYDNALVYVTLAGGGLLVVDSSTTPMAIVGEYGNEVINGAGCAGAQANGRIHLDAGVSAGASGLTQSTFVAYVLPHRGFPSAPAYNPENTPQPAVVLKDANNTTTNGNAEGPAQNQTGQIPGTTTRRDAHGVVATLDEKYVHIGDRIQNRMEVVKTSGLSKHMGTYDLTSAKREGRGPGPCAGASVTDDEGLPGNDPAPDLISRSPNNDYLFIAFRGPAPVTANHAAQGSCPGVGIVKLEQGGKSGRLYGILRTSNTIDTAPVASPGGRAYTGRERSDVHFVDVRRID